ncbi:MAG: hypothetical protein KAQ98_13440 [Bacteriovoracaceae bacterium]|nr:hypothetical protein [Bacteriovoracaceae bacterium]
MSIMALGKYIFIKMKLKENEIKELFFEYGINTMKGRLVENAAEAYTVAKEMGSDIFSVKANVLVRGREEIGEIRRACNADEVKKFANDLFENPIISPEGEQEIGRVTSIVVEEAFVSDISFYLTLYFDRISGKTIFIVSREKILHGDLQYEKNEKCIRAPADFATGFSPFIGRKLACSLEMNTDAIKKSIKTFEKLYRFFVDYDCKILELGPVYLGEGNELYVSGASMEIDNNALFRHEEFLGVINREGCQELELEAGKNGMTFVKFEGNIGCLVNGTGLGLATLDLIRLNGGVPANFMDVSGCHTSESVKNAISIVCRDKDVKVVLINIFAGAIRCDVIAGGIKHALEKGILKVPVVIRLDGNNMVLARKIINESGLKIVMVDSMADGVSKVIFALHTNDEVMDGDPTSTI